MLKPVLNQEDAVYYVSQSAFIEFLMENFYMDYDIAVEYLENIGIFNNLENITFYRKSDYKNPYTEGEKRIYDFFKAHPWIERMMVVFDD